MPEAQPQEHRVKPSLLAEKNTLKKMINNGLASGTICRKTSSCPAPILSMGKPEANFQQLHVITVKKKYSQLLTMELIDSLLKTVICTKLWICHTCGSLRVANVGEISPYVHARDCPNTHSYTFCSCQAGQFSLLSMSFAPAQTPEYVKYFIHTSWLAG